MTQLTMKDKIGYGWVRTACGFVWQAPMFLLAYSTHDVFGLPAGIMARCFGLRVLDAVTDPLMAGAGCTAAGSGQFRRSCCGRYPVRYRLR